MIKDYGKPKLYILLTMNWDTFKNRLFARGRKVEIVNFEANKEFFKKHIDQYEKHMEEIFINFGINYIKISTDNLSPKEISTIATKKIKEFQGE